MFTMSIAISPYGHIPRTVSFFALSVAVRLLNGENAAGDLRTVAELTVMSPHWS